MPTHHLDPSPSVPTRAPNTLDLDGFTYHIVALPPRRALKLLVRVLRAAGPGIVTVMAAWNAGKKLLDTDMEALGSMAHSMFVALTPDEHDAIMAELLATAQVEIDGKLRSVMPIFDAHFQGRLPAALSLEWEALAENYRDFGDALAGLVGKAGASRSAESTPISGPSTDSSTST